MKSSIKNIGLLLTVLFLIIVTTQTALAQEQISQSDYSSLSESVRQIQQRDASDESLYNQHAKLTASDGANDDNFGIRVAISGDTAVVGSWHDDVGANADQGSVYVFCETARACGVFSKNLPHPTARRATISVIRWRSQMFPLRVLRRVFERTDQLRLSNATARFLLV